MKILVKRIAKKNLYTIGKLYIDGVYCCDVIEDKDRGLKQSMSLEEIKKIKVPNETAIPTGTYNLTINVVSPKFKNRTWAKPYGGRVPRILDVPGYSGILIHPGSDQNSSSGCLILGKNKVVGKVVDSQATFKAFMDKLQGQKSITITIE